MVFVRSGCYPSFISAGRMPPFKMVEKGNFTIISFFAETFRSLSPKFQKFSTKFVKLLPNFRNFITKFRSFGDKITNGPYYARIVGDIVSDDFAADNTLEHIQLQR